MIYEYNAQSEYANVQIFSYLVPRLAISVDTMTW